jgi:hypothetical protein
MASKLIAVLNRVFKPANWLAKNPNCWTRLDISLPEGFKFDDATKAKLYSVDVHFVNTLGKKGGFAGWVYESSRPINEIPTETPLDIIKDAVKHAKFVPIKGAYKAVATSEADEDYEL